MIVLIQQPVQSVFPTRIPGDHPAARRHPASPPQIKKKVWTRLSYRRRSLFVSAEVERMAHWSAYGSRVFFISGLDFCEAHSQRVHYDSPTGNRTPIYYRRNTSLLLVSCPIFLISRGSVSWFREPGRLSLNRRCIDLSSRYTTHLHGTVNGH